MVSRSSIELANKRGEQLRREFPHAVAARYDRASGKVVVELSSKLTLSFSPQDAVSAKALKKLPSYLRQTWDLKSRFSIAAGGTITSTRVASRGSSRIYCEI